jgi:hypothetical protein
VIAATRFTRYGRLVKDTAAPTPHQLIAKKRIVRASIAMLSLFINMTVASRVLQAQPKCGVERWPVKVLGDRDAWRVNLKPLPVTIAELAATPRPVARLSQDRRIAPHELQTYVVRARLWRISTQEDGDWHVELRDPERPTEMMIAEIPAPECAPSPELAARYSEVRVQLRKFPRHAIVLVSGVAFFDHFHNQRGRAPNGIELHPVLEVVPAVPR